MDAESQLADSEIISKGYIKSEERTNWKNAGKKHYIIFKAAAQGNLVSFIIDLGLNWGGAGRGLIQWLRTWTLIEIYFFQWGFISGGADRQRVDKATAARQEGQYCTPASPLWIPEELPSNIEKTWTLQGGKGRRKHHSNLSPEGQTIHAVEQFTDPAGAFTSLEQEI